MDDTSDQLDPELAERVRAYFGAFLPAAEVDDAVDELIGDVAFWGDDRPTEVFGAAHTVLHSRARVAEDVEILVLSDDVGLANEEVADVLGTDPDEVRATLDSALAELEAEGLLPAEEPPPPAPAAPQPPEPTGVEVEEPPPAGAERDAVVPPGLAEPVEPDLEQVGDAGDEGVVDPAARTVRPTPAIVPPPTHEPPAETGVTAPSTADVTDTAEDAAGPDGRVVVIGDQDDADEALPGWAGGDGGRPGSWVPAILGLLLIGIIVVGVIAAGRGDTPDTTPTVGPTQPVATDTGPGTPPDPTGEPTDPQAACDAPVCIERAQLTNAVDEQGEPGEERESFTTDEEVRLWFEYARGSEEPVVLTVRWYRGDELLYPSQFQLPQVSRVSLVLVPDVMQQPGDYRVEIVHEDEILVTRDFTVEAGEG